jgi:hypothetical protein
VHRSLIHRYTHNTVAAHCVYRTVQLERRPGSNGIDELMFNLLVYCASSFCKYVQEEATKCARDDGKRYEAPSWSLAGTSMEA